LQSLGEGIGAFSRADANRSAFTFRAATAGTSIVPSTVLMANMRKTRDSHPRFQMPEYFIVVTPST